jgi:DNA-binding transcriptional ArsR family regulator
MARREHAHARVFAALGGEVRLRLVTRLCAGRPRSIAQLTAGSGMTRQAVTKHLRVLERAGIVHGIRAGRERRYEFDPQPIGEIQKYLESVSAQWDRTLGRLKAFVES